MSLARRERLRGPRDYALAFIILNKQDTWYFKATEAYTIEDYIQDIYDPKKQDQRYVYRRIGLNDGAKVKIPNKQFVDQLKAFGAIGERTGDEQALVDFAKAAVPFIEGMYDGFVQAGKDAAQEMWNMLRDLLTGELLEQFKQLYEFFKNADAKQLQGLIEGAVGDFDKKWNNTNEEEKWHFRGEITGQILFEVVIAVLTGGSGGALTKLKQIKSLEKTISKFENIVNTAKDKFKIPDSLKEKLKIIKGKTPEEKSELSFIGGKNKDETIKEAFDRKKKEFETEFEKTKQTPEFRQRLSNAYKKYGGTLSEKEYIDRYETLFKNRKIGKIGEEVFEKFKGGKAKSFKVTIDGKVRTRNVDNFADNVAREIKTGPLKNTEFIREQIKKDLRIKQLEGVDIEWHLFNGGDPELIKFMKSQGIKIITY